MTKKIGEEDVCGYTAIFVDDEHKGQYSEIWDSCLYLFSVPTHDYRTLEIAVIAYKQGEESGKISGKVEAQSQIKKALGL